MNSNPGFVADYPGAIVYPAHPSNYYRPGEAPFNHGPNQPKGMVLHTPEEPADAVESTPAFFAQPGRAASTHYYGDNDGDIYQLVPEHCAAIANGVVGKPYPGWADASHSLNWQTLSIEFEGFASTIHQTMLVNGPQFNSAVRFIDHRAHARGFPTDREHIIGHYQVSNQRTDPGALFPWVPLMNALGNFGLEEDMYHQHDVYATKGIWASPPLRIPGGATQQLNAVFDFDLPSDAKRVQVEFMLLRGYLTVLNGDGRVAGRVGWGTVAQRPSYESIVVNLVGGWFAVRADDTSNPVEFSTAHAVAYWT